ncbi:MAG: sugar ABC transporter ATP-binding protein [Ignisphaera sp.]
MSNRQAVLAERIVKRFPGVVAVNDVTFELRYGEIHGLLGQNGAGKSTLLRVIYGVYRPEQGSIYINGRKVFLKSPRDARNHGIALVHQEITVIPSLTVLENIALLGFSWNSLASKFDYTSFKEYIEKIMARFDIGLNMNERVRHLSAAERMLLQVIAALSINAKILLLDEPTSPLSLHEIERLFNVLNQLKKEGLAIAFVTHRVNEAIDICDRITILRNGEKIDTVESRSTDVHSLIKLMLGREPEELYRVRDEKSFDFLLGKYAAEKPLIELRGVYTQPQIAAEIPLKNINIKVYQGEVVAIFGFIGAGKTEIGKTLMGLTKIVKGDILYMGRGIKIKSPVDAINHGIFYLPEDRKIEGLIPHFTVASNMDISSLDVIKRFTIFIDEKRELQIAYDMVKKLNIVTPSPYAKIIQLSGGNQQKVLVARAMLTNAKLVIFDEPTVGIDIGAKAEIRRLIFRYSRERGTSSLILTSDVDEAIGLADRIYVMRDGEIIREYYNKKLDRDEILKNLA